MSFWIVPVSFGGRDALFFAGDDVEREDRQHRAVHGHADAHLVERNAVEQGAHVVDRVDRDAGHADIAADALVIGIVAPVGGKIEGDGEALLAGRQIAPVERVGVFRRREPGILAHGPRLGNVHGRVGAAEIRREARKGLQEVEAVKVCAAS